MNRTNLGLLAIIVVVIAVWIISISNSDYFNFSNVNFNSQNNAANVQSSETTTLTLLSSTSKSRVILNVPAVDNSGNGISTILEVDAEPGTGRVLADINNLLFWVDTQNSIQIAERVAQSTTGIDTSHTDLIYSLQSNATLIEGPSAGAALTIATVAALENKTLNSHVMITGTINPDGTIGPVGDVEAKAEAAKSVGATLFLVPVGRSNQTSYVPEEKCQMMGPINYCTTDYEQQTAEVGKMSGINVIEVANITDALKYFLS